MQPVYKFSPSKIYRIAIKLAVQPPGLLRTCDSGWSVPGRCILLVCLGSSANAIRPEMLDYHHGSNILHLEYPSKGRSNS
jgi:hypothetical protein